MTMKNDYLEEVQAKQQMLEEDLNVRAPAAPAAAFAGAMPSVAQAIAGPDSSSRLQRARTSTAIRVQQAVDVKVTGFWRWKTVIVPPNAYVVHTRRGHAEPLDLGMGISFGFDPYRDAFLVVPSTMQTILINAHCICKELQGILVQGYVQWIIADFGVAYKKLDFTDLADPMRVVNIQLREQAEAAIKDKVSTMSIDDVLSDKQPIIQELTARLRHVAEGEGDPSKGLGLRIVTVQIKEAVVSSARLWENLQMPFRSDRDQVARLAALAAAATVENREREQQQQRETAQLQTESEIARLRAEKEAETFNREQGEHARRYQLEMEQKHKQLLQETGLQVAEAAKKGEAATAQAALDRQLQAEAAAQAAKRLEAELAAQEQRVHAQLAEIEARNREANRQAEAEIGFERARQETHNNMSPAFVQARLVDMLPAIAEKLPKPDELRTIAIGNDGGGEAKALASMLAQIMAVVDLFRGNGASAGNAPDQS